MASPLAISLTHDSQKDVPEDQEFRDEIDREVQNSSSNNISNETQSQETNGYLPFSAVLGTLALSCLFSKSSDPNQEIERLKKENYELKRKIQFTNVGLDTHKAKLSSWLMRWDAAKEEAMCKKNNFGFRDQLDEIASDSDVIIIFGELTIRKNAVEAAIILNNEKLAQFCLEKRAVF